MLAVLMRLVSLILPYKDILITLVTGLSKRNLIILACLLGLAVSHIYVYNMGYNSCVAKVEKKTNESNKKNSKIRNSAIDNSVVIDKLLNDKF